MKIWGTMINLHEGIEINLGNKFFYPPNLCLTSCSSKITPHSSPACIELLSIALRFCASINKPFFFSCYFVIIFNFSQGE